MKRRDFLRATLVTAGSILAPAACSDDPDEQPTPCVPVDGAAFFPQSVASGDPRESSVILWTRVDDPEAQGDLFVQVKVALDEAFTQVVGLVAESDRKATADAAGLPVATLLAEAAFDRCVKVKVAGLEPGTTYYYQFFYSNAAGCFRSAVGRTKTAPAPDADVPVRFAYVSCQDFIGRYYNSHLLLAKQEIDFFVHLGDYVYETTGDPGFQNPTEDRKVSFTDLDGALELTTADGQPYYAARSLSNYRELYRTYRSDPALQAVHQLFPMLATWDDHEFSDDSHGATASYFDGRSDELDVERRKAGNKAWFEYMPVDYQAGDDFVYDETVEYPQDIAIYRDFTFGRHLHLVVTDLRTYRADHVIPEEAFPGTVAATEEALTAGGAPLPDAAAPYVDVDSYANGIYKQPLIDAAAEEGYDPAHVAGKLSGAFINKMVEKLNATLPPAEQLPLIDLGLGSGLQRGFSYLDAGKSAYYSSIGSRYFVVKEAFDAIGKYTWDSTAGASEEVMGAEQEAWFLDRMTTSSQTWKVWANEYCLTQFAVDLGAPPAPPDLPDTFKKQFNMNCDAWEGFRNKRSELIEKLSAVPNVVAITGDIHAFYAATPTANDDPSKRIVEFVGSSISSQTFKEMLLSQVASDPVLSTVPNSDALAGIIDVFLRKPTNPHLAYANSGDNGFCVAEVSAEEMVVTMHQIPAAEVSTNHGLEPDLAALEEKVKQVRFKAVAGAPDLYMEQDGAWVKWDAATQAWV
ncbi:MAG: alkaline phosphatase D family protein [Polyangiaceae bacterium]|nr:alkaline phosphatase D family protein [Polyangiaceae bacterium]